MQEVPQPPLHHVATKIVVDDECYLPQYQTELAACCDLVANIPEDAAGVRQYILPHRATQLIDCGFCMELQPGYKALISARSGLASRGLIITNAPGTVDPDYRGRVRCLVTNVGKEVIVIQHLDRIAQMAIHPIYVFQWESVEVLTETERGSGGFGSTGVK